MKYEVKKNEDGSVDLNLGLNHGITFTEDVPLEGITMGVTLLIEKVTGVSALDLTMAVLKELGRINDDGTLVDG